MKLAIVSLGCPKNQVDADVFCHSLIKAGHTTVAQREEADVIIINTCGFIQSAKEEAIEQILDACANKEQNPDLKIVVTGCLAERYKQEVAKEIPEIDAVVGIGKYDQLPQLIGEMERQKGQVTQELYGPKADLQLGGSRVIGTPLHYAWLKIAEGCSNACSYCAIPLIRGPLRSRPLEDCLQEAEWLAQEGVKELVLVAQDVSAYGEDKGQNQIVPLLDALNQIEGLHWIRILYAYPERITPELLDAMARNSKVVPYLDLPIQHCNDEILLSMGRKGTNQSLRNTIRMIREKLPNAVLRTTLIAGYPGETQEQFEELCQFVKEMQFDRLGCFAYSAEDGTRAAQMPNQLDEEERSRRADLVMELQSRIMMNKQEQMVGKTMEVVADELDPDEGIWRCRSAADAPEIDANVLLDGETPLEPGAFYQVVITRADGYDLMAHLL